ncbi:MAG: tRNA (adenosine(37)-N6)-dimethylallyltransferase MiaA, partial [Alkalispirochaeta sp.]
MSTPTLLLVGPTAVGKTAALDVLTHDSTTVPLEIISADSRQVYRMLDIGTAKPDDHLLRRIPHHLINVVSPDESWNVGRFVEASDALVSEIRDRGAAPVICGGTAFYHHGYIFGLPGTPQGSSALRRRLEDRLCRDGLEALRRELRVVDPESDRRIAANDRYRVVRALEVYHTSGRPLSSYTVPSTPRSGVTPVIVGLYRPREELYQRIAARVDRMFEEGLPDEVVRVVECG